jgi:hypothetical protein
VKNSVALNSPIEGQIARSLKAFYSGLLAEPLSDRLRMLVEKLEVAERERNGSRVFGTKR